MAKVYQDETMHVYYFWNPKRQTIIYVGDCHKQLRDTSTLFRNHLKDAKLMLKLDANEQDKMQFDTTRVFVGSYRSLSNLLEDEKNVGSSQERIDLIKNTFESLMGLQFKLF